MKYNNDFINIINDLLDNNTVQSLRVFKHHYSSSRFEHCMSVAYYSYLICKHLNLDYVSASRAGLLHDLFLYDCESKNTKLKYHTWIHPKIALENSKNLFDLNQKECDIILKHMWPITVRPPKYWESFIVSCVDKYCALHELSKYFTYLFFIYFCTYKKLDFII